MIILADETRCPVGGISITISETKKRTEYLDLGEGGIIRIRVMPYYCINGDKQLEIIKNKQKHNIPLNEYDTWFLSIEHTPSMILEKKKCYWKWLN